jgi:hypothetical protein
MTVKVRFMQSGQFNSGTFRTLDLDRITRLQINHLRNTCELHAFTPENPRPDSPFLIATRDNAYVLQKIVDELQRLRQEKRDLIYEITATGAGLLPSGSQ